MINEKPNILYIDDEVNNLTAFSSAFRHYYNVLTAESVEKGRLILKNEEIHIIITDQRMPDMSGVEFLESILDEYPDPIRMLLTGYDDIEPIITAVNKIGIYRYISKPWDDNELRMTLQNAYEIYCTRNLLKIKTEQLQKAYNELDRFAYSASHDLRAPLTSILGIINLAKMEGKKDKYLDMIEKSVHKLDVFTKNIINYYRNAKQTEQITEINFQQVLKETLDHIHLFSDTSRIKITTEVNQTDHFSSDDTRLRIILNNLITNAIKYQDKDKDIQEISVVIRVENGFAMMEIKDNGIGIDPEHISNIFKMFYRATSENYGSGLGLYIVKEIVHKLGGEIHVSSEKGKGSVFTVTIPHKELAGHISA
jgi:two-component system, sensor histidine kinase and response regulator